MADYQDIRGLRVKYLSADPGDPASGEVWYNSTTATLKTRLLSEAWSSGSSLTADSRLFINRVFTLCNLSFIRNHKPVSDNLISSFNSEKKLSTLESVKDHVTASVKPFEATDL